MKRLVVMSLIATLVVGMFGCTKKQETIKIGSISPNTGELAAHGTAEVNGIKLAISEINEAGGINGKKLELIVKDDQASTTEGVTAFNDLLGEDTCAIIGSVTSSVTGALKDYANEEQIVLLTPGATADSLTTDDDYVFRACFSDSFQGLAAAKYAAELGKKKVAVLYATGDTFSSGLHDAFVKACGEYGLEIVAEKSSSNVTDTEFRTQLTAIAESGAEFLFAPYYYSVVGPNLIPQAREVGYDGVIVGPDGYDGTENYTAGSPEDYENVYYTNHYSSEDDSEKVQKFVKAYEDKYDKESLNGLSALSYDAMYMLADAIEKAGSTDRKKIRDAMSGMEFEGVTGHFTLDKTGTPSKSVVVMGFFVEGDKVVEKFVETLK